MKTETNAIIFPQERIEKSILLIRNRKVMLDRDLASLYEVETKVLKQAVRRNIERFPDDFMFILTDDEFKNLRSQFVTSSSWGGLRYSPMAFTEQGVAMLSSVLRSQRAIDVNIAIMRTFVKLWKTLLTGFTKIILWMQQTRQASTLIVQAQIRRFFDITVDINIYICDCIANNTRQAYVFRDMLKSAGYSFMEES